jgi:hypothetical protein
LEWAIGETYAEDDKDKPVLPKSGFVKRREFINYLKDGVILARLANNFQPGAAEAVKEGEEAKTKENQQSNINVFSSVAKRYVSEDQVFTHDDLEKGKENYVKVFSTFFKVMSASSAEHFKRPGGDFDQFVNEVAAVVPQKFWQKLVSSFNTAGDYITGFVRRPVSLPLNSFLKLTFSHCLVYQKQQHSS